MHSIDTAYCYRCLGGPSCVCLLVTTVKPAKTAKCIEMSFRL